MAINMKKRRTGDVSVFEGEEFLEKRRQVRGSEAQVQVSF